MYVLIFLALAYREIQLRMPSIPDAKRAKDVIDRLSPPKTSGTVLDVPPPPGGKLNSYRQ